eukprot:COSAG06_NODE_4426_length_4278_cov_26.527638_2_plen_172_part_00
MGRSAGSSERTQSLTSVVAFANERNLISGLIQKCISVICPCRRREPAPARARPHPQPPRRVLNSTNRQPSPCTRQATHEQQQPSAAGHSSSITSSTISSSSSSSRSSRRIQQQLWQQPVYPCRTHHTNATACSTGGHAPGSTGQSMWHRSGVQTGKCPATNAPPFSVIPSS